MPEPTGARRRTPPGALPLGVIGVLAGCLLAWRSTLHSGLFDDVFWHEATGLWMIHHHQVLTRDTLSYTVLGRRWITPEWGYGVLLAEAVRVLGPVAFWLLSAGVASLAVVCVAARCRLSGAGWLWTGLLCAEAGAAIEPFLEDRPQVVSYLLVALLLLVLSAARRRRGLLWLLVPMFAFWANVHGSFLLGLTVLGLEVLQSWVPPRLGRLSTDPLSRRTSGLTLLGCAAATLVNPFGPGVYQAALGVTFNSTIRRFISEWQSPDFHDPATVVIVVLPVAVTVAFAVLSARPLPALDLVLAGLLFVATLDSYRFAPYFAIAWCGLAARTPPIPREQLRPTLLTWPLGAVLALGMLQGPWVPAGRPAAIVPVAAVGYLEHHPGRVFSTYLWNDYLDLKGIPVFIDGRTELYTGTPVFGQYLELQDLTADPDPILESYHVRYVLWPPDTPLSQYLSHDPLWRVVRRSDRSVVYRYAGPDAEGRREPAPAVLLPSAARARPILAQHLRGGSPRTVGMSMPRALCSRARVPWKGT
jgi:hypothetical protein